MSRSLGSIYFQAMGERSEGEESLLSYSKVTGWATQKEVLGYDIDTESMAVALPARKVHDLRARVTEWIPERAVVQLRQAASQ